MQVLLSWCRRTGLGRRMQVLYDVISHRRSAIPAVMDQVSYFFEEQRRHYDEEAKETAASAEQESFLEN